MKPLKSFLLVSFSLLFFFKIFGGHEYFLWGHWYPCFGLLVMSPLGFKARVGSLIWAWWRHMCYMFPEIHLWWQHLLTSWQPAWQPSHLFHIPERHWWDLKPGAIMPLLTVWDQAGLTLYWLSYPAWLVSFSLHFPLLFLLFLWIFSVCCMS